MYAINNKIPTTDKNNNLFLHAMPLSTKNKLCVILDENEKWKELAIEHMRYDKSVIMEIKSASLYGKSFSPTEKLLSLWADLNHTVIELFALLLRMKQYDAMEAIKDLVDTKFHRFIPSNLPNFSLIKSSSHTIDTAQKNLNDPTRDKHLPQQPIGNKVKQKESEKILNVSIEDNESRGPSSSNRINVNTVDELASKIPEIDYNELVTATENWKDENKLGHGGFGTVYKGLWKMTEVAIKRLENRGSGHGNENVEIQMQQSLNELKYLNSARHDNILPLYGYSKNGSEPCLVYQLMIGGSLEQRLKKNNLTPLSWRQRLNVAQGTARGLQYLHTFKQKPLIHGDIKPANILLDPCSQPRIGDFGLAREGPNTLNSSVEVSRVYGTRPYLPSDFLSTKRLSTSVDTFSFGVVLYELATGFKAYDSNRKYKFLSEYMSQLLKHNVRIDEIMDPTCPRDENGERVAQIFIYLGKKCTNDDPSRRPEMSEVLSDLLKIFN